MAVGENLVVAFRNPGHVIHTRSPAAGPVSPVLPGAVELPPLGVGDQCGENPMQAVDIAELLVIQQLSPRQKIGSGRGRVIALETIGAVSPDLTADETVLVLLGVEVIQRPLEREETVTVTGEHHHERIVPHEYVPVVGDIEVRRHKAGTFLRLTDIPDSDLPGMPIHLNLFLMALPDWCGKDFLGLLK